MIHTVKTTYIDIETSPNIGTFWRPGYNVSLSFENIMQERVILCAAWRHEGEDKTQYSDRLRFNKKGEPNDKKIVQDICKGLKDTELLVFHNGDKFDLPWINGRALFHRLPKVAPVRTVDTLKVARKLFNLNSYRLDYIGKYLGLGRKLHTGYDLWKKVMEGNSRAMAKMVKYNIQDVDLLREVYLAMEPYNDSPVVSNTVDSNNPVCTFCGSSHMQKRGRILNLRTYRFRYQCMGCNKFLKSELFRKDSLAV